MTKLKTAAAGQMRAADTALPDTVAASGGDAALRLRADRLAIAALAEEPTYGLAPYMALLANVIERDSFGEDADGVRLGPSDAQLCVECLRRAAVALSPALPAEAAPTQQA